MATIEERAITEIRIKADDKKLEELRHKALKKFISRRIDEIKVSLKEMCEEFEERFVQNEWILIDDAFYYVNDVVAFVPNIKSSDLNWNNSSSLVDKIDEKYLNFENRQGDIPTAQEAKAIFGKDNPFRKSTGKIEDYDGITVDDGKSFYLISEDKFYEYGSKEVKERKILTLPIYRLNGKDSKKISTPKVILSWLSEGTTGVRPNFKTESLSKIYGELKKLRTRGYFAHLQPSSSENTLVFDNENELIQRIYDDGLKNDKFIFLGKKDVDKILKEQKEFEADEEFLDEFKKKFLECDEIRAALGSYQKELLTMNQGHWDLFDYNDSIDSDIVVKLPYPVYSRDPKDDIVKSWVGIDFGTKSTVVSYRDTREGQKVIPINVGKVTGYSDLKNYENPSIMYFIDFDKFWKDYNSKEGRPETSWSDLTVAYDALNDLKIADERSFESFLTDLKSWCGSNDIVRVKPRENEEPLEFKKFLEIGDGDPNPVEYYAYFLGLYINNMHNGKIFMNYKISFPVTYQKELRKKIVDSFEKGIKKSLPTSLREAMKNDPKLRKKFKINDKTSEPAAYAATALEKFRFDPSADEEEYYSVFDFGGGTTDFDFGVYRGISKSDRDSQYYDHRLIHFGYDGDRRLGGEKLLKYLAFEIFKINKDKLFLKDGSMIQFTLDEGRTEGECVGFVRLVKGKSTYANRNMYNLMEKLRWAWEGVKQGEEYLEEDYRNGSIYVDLINNKGEVIPNFCLSSYKQNEDGSSEFVDLQELLRERIDKAVEKFFKSMRTAFKDGANDKRYNIKPLEEISNINIFLAGNSSKSKLFRDILNSYISDDVGTTSDYSSNLNYDYSMSEYSNDLSKDFVPPTLSTSAHCKAKKLLELGEDSTLQFEIFPPLGTDEAREKQKNRGYNVDIDDKTEPTGKTGVAYGLLVNRLDVKTVSATEDGDVGFHFYFGKPQSGNKFQTIIGRYSAFGRWHKIWDMREDIDDETYTYLYTDSPDADTGTMDAKVANGYTFDIYEFIDEVEDGMEIWVRSVAKNKVEWRIVRDEKELESELKEPKIIELK